MEHMSGSIAELVWLYVKRRPFLKETLREGVINHSALARRISKELSTGKGSEAAVKMALIRLSGRLRRSEGDLESSILRVLRESSITIRSKVAVLISSKELEGVKYLSYAESRGALTYVVEEKEAERHLRARALKKSESNLNLISIHSPEELEDVPGVIAHILNSLAMEGINVVEFISCYTDTLLVVRQPDTARAYEMLSSLMGD